MSVGKGVVGKGAMGKGAVGKGAACVLIITQLNKTDKRVTVEENIVSDSPFELRISLRHSQGYKRS